MIILPRQTRDKRREQSKKRLFFSQMSVPLKAGSVLFFHDLLLHASNPNVNGADRYCMIPTYRAVSDNDPVRAPLTCARMPL
jgi:ectoine hydroxylase-related dioxygenase (phytanoyl-CoA dioxygenase family)